MTKSVSFTVFLDRLIQIFLEEEEEEAYILSEIMKIVNYKTQI